MPATADAPQDPAASTSSDAKKLEQFFCITKALQDARTDADSVTLTAEMLPGFLAAAVRATCSRRLGDHLVQLDMLFWYLSSAKQPLSQHAAVSKAPCCPTSLLGEPAPAQEKPQEASSATSNHATQAFGTAAAALDEADTASAAVVEPVHPVHVFVGSHATRQNITTRSNELAASHIQWVYSAAIVPEGIHSAAAAQLDGGLASMEIAATVMALRDGAPASAPPALSKVLSRGEKL
jgi:hypothetical protein